MNFKQLSIAIPTYKRTNEFARLIQQIYAQYHELDLHLKQRIHLTVYENPSEQTNYKYELFSHVKSRCSFGNFHKNEINIGGDANIEQAYASVVNCKHFLWVLGDDEQLLESAIKNIIGYLDEARDLGLLIIRDNTYKIKEELLRTPKWTSYAQFAQQTWSIQPHMLIAHTLISANIIRSDLFSVQASVHDRVHLSKRSSLPFCFAHMRGFLSSLSESNYHLEVHILTMPVINTAQRAKNEQDYPDHQNTIYSLYLVHIMWLCQEFGLNPWRAFTDPMLLNIGPNFNQLFHIIFIHLCCRSLRLCKSIPRLLIRVLTFAS